MDKPALPLTPDLRDMYRLHARACRVLSEAGQPCQAQELLRRGHEVPSYHRMVALVGEYLELQEGKG